MNFITSRFSHLLPYNSPIEQNRLYNEYLEYQLLADEEIPTDVWTRSGGRLDVLWAHLGKVTSRVSGIQRFPRLAQVAKLVLVLPHSNADAERVFSMIGLNKGEVRNALALEGTLSSLIKIKMANLEPCQRYEPPKDVIKASKKATYQYNKEHKS